MVAEPTYIQQYTITPTPTAAPTAAPTIVPTPTPTSVIDVSQTSVTPSTMPVSRSPGPGLPVALLCLISAAYLLVRKK
jgi:carbohydrate-binding DOMON domain-containing protein